MMTYTQAVANLASYLAPHLKPGIDATSYAGELLMSREPSGGALQLEVPGRYTIDGNPLPVTVDEFDE